MKLTRREILVAGSLLAGCGRTQPDCDGSDIPPSSPPAACWEEDEDVNVYNDPMVLFAATDVAPGASAAPPTPALANPHGLPMEILEIRFRVAPRITVDDSYVTLAGQAVTAKFDLGQAAISDDKVPLSVFGTMADTYEQTPGDPLAEEYSLPDAPVASNPRVTPQAYGWRLKYPLYVPPGSVLVPKFSSLTSAFQTRVEVAYVCRSVQAKAPTATVMVPWVGAFNSKSVTSLTGEPAQQPDVSSQLDLVNPFSVPLEIARLGGRVLFMQNSDGTLVNVLEEEKLHFRNRFTKLRMRSSRGHDLIRGPAPFDLAFPANWRSWDFAGGWSMTPGEFYTATLETSLVDYVVGSPVVGRIQFAVGLTGYRPVRVASLMGEP